MEPMELDDDRTSYPPQFYQTKFGRCGRSSAPPSLSSFAPQIHSPSFSHFAQASFRCENTGTLAEERSRQSSASPFKTRQPSLLKAKSSAQVSEDFRFVHPSSPMQHSFTRGATPSRAGSDILRGTNFSLEKVSRQSTVASPGNARLFSEDSSYASMETSTCSDVSDMEVIQNSPSLSPPMDRVRSALSDISLLRSASCPEEVSTAHSSYHDHERLSIAQAATSANSVISRPSTPMRRLQGEERNSEVDTLSTRESMGSKPELDPVAQGGNASCCSCGLCLKLFSSLMVLLAVMFAFLPLDQFMVHHRDYVTSTALLRNDMSSNVFGQHIATTIIPDSIGQYLSDLQALKNDSEKDACHSSPLVLSLHGWTGVGKTLVSNTVVRNFPRNMVKKFLVPFDFRSENLDHRKLEDWVLSNVTEFYVNIFIFDEMDKAGSDVILGLQGALVKLRHQNSCHSPTVFILLSNTFGVEINKIVFQAMIDGLARDSLKIDNFSHLFHNTELPPWYQQLQPLITVTVPFLPLEKEHIIQCIRADLVRKSLSTHSELVNGILDQLLFTQLPDGKEFSQTGCKRVSDKVNLIAFG